ncbi:MAG: hypothetical protein WDO73_27335 [Ignavibacteriota bacterium]
MRTAGIVSVLLVATTSSFPVLAQDAVSPQSTPTIRITATEVALDMVVRDKKGRQVKNVKPGEIEIYEDGVRQQVLSFRTVAGREQDRRESAQGKSEGTKVGRRCSI